MALQIEYDKYRLIGTPGLVLSDVTNVVLTGVNDGLAAAVRRLREPHANLPPLRRSAAAAANPLPRRF